MRPPIRHGIILIATLAFAGCATRYPEPAGWHAWQVSRTEAIGGTNGWTSLVGLHWLREGENFAGRATTNQVVLRSDRVPDHIGVFLRRGMAVAFRPDAGVEVRVDGRRIGLTELTSDALPEPTKLQIGSVTMVMIQRGERLGVRVRDPESPARSEFKGLSWFPYDPAWRIEGRFVAFPEKRKLRVPDVTGATQEFVSPGAIVFKAGGREQRLAVIEERGEPDYFIIFRDRTTGDSTYEAGRFLYVAQPGADGRVTIDFNRAHTPPCGFTSFATCPLPPSENTLAIAVRAGERRPPGKHQEP